ncbi:MAG: tRNA pseudouridine synthase A [Planctomycetota bacterium]|jgi:tRNA pseudouridine38-40 synthase|nr:tRNA pseudouridine synthase A [Planctomycetota bacterium]
MRFALILAYDGGDFAGFWRQPGRRTVASVCDEAFARINEPEARVDPAARTDTGVHARGQVAHVDLARQWEPATLREALDHHLSSDCSCVAAARVSDTWQARDSVAKTYRYRLDIGSPRSPFLARTSWRPPQALQHEDLYHAAELLLGQHDMRAFARRGDHRDNHLVTLTEVAWQLAAPELACTITGDRFTYRLVRSLVGAMVATACGACDLDQLRQALDGTPTDACRHQAPPRGLCLERVHYAHEPNWTLTTA